MTPSIRVRRLLAGAPLVIALSGVAALPLPAAAQASCEAKIMSSGQIWGDALQMAVDEAPGGDTIQIRGGCLGPVVINKNLTLVGKPSTVLGAPGIYGQESVRVLEITPGKTVTIKNLEIAYGLVEAVGVGGESFPGQGGGILNQGKLTLTNVVVQENDAAFGAGIANHGTLLVNGASQIHHNRATDLGGGIYSGGKVTIAGTVAVHDNTAGNFGGGVVVLPGSSPTSLLTVRDAAVVRNNTATDGGGIATSGVPVLLRDTASVRNNTAIESGGIYLMGARLTMEGRSSVKGNTGGTTGGIFGEAVGSKVAKVTLTGSSVVKGNTGQIGGIFLQSGTLTMLRSSSIRDHRTTTSSATVAIAEDGPPATFTMKDRSIVTGNRVMSGWAAVLKLACPSGTPTFVGVKARVTGNTPKNIRTACP